MSFQTPSLIGSVVERQVNSKPTISSKSPSSTGFPSVQHRSKSAFARAREAKRNNGARSSSPQSVPIVKRASMPQSIEWRTEIAGKGVLKRISFVICAPDAFSSSFRCVQWFFVQKLRNSKHVCACPSCRQGRGRTMASANATRQRAPGCKHVGGRARTASCGNS